MFCARTRTLYFATMISSESVFSFTLDYLAPVGAVMLLGLLGGKAARYLKLPKVSGYLLTGIVIGPSVLHLISTETVTSLAIINDLALGLIMFAIGGVFEIHHIRSVGRKILWLTIGQSVATFVLVTLALRFVGLHIYPALLLGTIAIATAPAAPLLVIREYEAKGDFTDTLVTIVATSNIVCILTFEFALSAVEISTHGTSLLYAVISPFYELGGSLLIGFAVGYVISWWEQHIDDQAELLMIIVAGIILVIGLANTFNLQPLFASLIMGAVTTNFSLMHRLVYIELRQVEQPLYIAFFVLAGASLHLDLLPGLGIAGVVYLVTRVAGKVIGVYSVSRWRHLTADIRKRLGLGMVVQAGVAIGLVETVNRSSTELSNVVTPIILATVLIYETVGPPIIRYVLIKAGDVEQGKL
ncbi:MAG: cation:proton antiporter [candidate division Zixibacteria bacterium]|nr:cation:proton antiporter [candidate division Zixibacteria bacterium]